MNSLEQVAPAFVSMAHRIVWASAATVGPDMRPLSRILHPIWEWDGNSIRGWIGTGPSRLKREHLEACPYISLSYWSPNHDTCQAECRAKWAFDDESCSRLWDRFKSADPPVGFDPALIPDWNAGPTSKAFAVIELDPWRLRVFPGTILLRQGGKLLDWRRESQSLE